MEPFTMTEREKTIGTIRKNTFSFEWIIENFSSLSDNHAYRYLSPPFECSDAAWNILLYPNGCEKSYIGWISVYIVKRHPKDSNVMVDAKISVKCDDDIIHTRTSLNTVFSRNVGWREFLRRAEVLEKLRTSLQKVLTISCVITWNTSIGDTEQQDSFLESASVISKPKASLGTLVRNLKDLYINKSNCDFTISVRGQVLPAHKAILGARSSVFAAAFAHDMAENRSGTMEIDDFDPEIVKDFLMYMYTGDVDNLSCKNVSELYAISDKYDVQDLKEECLEFMKSKLSLETVCEVLLLAEKYTETELFKLAKNFVAKCAAELLKSDHWEEFASENSLLAHKILKMIVLDNSWRIK